MRWTGRMSRVLGQTVVALAVLAGPTGAAQATTNLTGEVTAGINAVRAQHGLGALPTFSTSAQVQRAHDHFVSTGQMHGLFAESAGFYFDRGASDFAEVQSYVEGEECSADALVEEWVKSDYHRGLILTPDATHLEVAATCDGPVARATGHVITAPESLVQDDPEPTQADPDSDPPDADPDDGAAPGADDTTVSSTDTTGDSELSEISTDEDATGDPSAPATGDTTAPATGDPSAPATGDTTAPASGDTTAPASGDITAPASGDITAPASGDTHERYRLADRGLADRKSPPPDDSAKRQSDTAAESATDVAASGTSSAAEPAGSEPRWLPQYPAAAVLTAGSLPLGLVLVSRRRRR